jgi:hypothetical protein
MAIRLQPSLLRGYGGQVAKASADKVANGE